MISRLAYFTEKAIGAMRQAPGVSFVTTTTIAAALVVLGLFVTAFTSLEGFARTWGRAARVSVYIADDVPEARWQDVRTRVSLLPGVADAQLVTPAQALERFRARGPEAQALVAGVSSDVLPAVVELTVTEDAGHLDSMARLAESARTIAGVSEVDYGREEFRRLQALVDALRYGGLLAGILVALATAFIVSNTIRLTVYARRTEIGVLRLVGATSWFIRAPFLIEGALWGAGGGALAGALLWLSDRMLATSLARTMGDLVEGLELTSWSPTLALGMLGAGTALGVLGSALAVRRFLEVEGL